MEITYFNLQDIQDTWNYILQKIYRNLQDMQMVVIFFEYDTWVQDILNLTHSSLQNIYRVQILKYIQNTLNIY